MDHILQLLTWRLFTRVWKVRVFQLKPKNTEHYSSLYSLLKPLPSLFSFNPANQASQTLLITNLLLDVNVQVCLLFVHHVHDRSHHVWKERGPGEESGGRYVTHLDLYSLYHVFCKITAIGLTINSYFYLFLRLECKSGIRSP